MDYIDVEQRRTELNSKSKDKYYRSPNQLARKMIELGDFQTIRGKLKSKNWEKGYRGLGNRIRNLEKGDFSWWAKKENREALVRLAEMLKVKVEQIPLENVYSRKKRLFYWDILPDAAGYDPVSEGIADLGFDPNVTLQFKERLCVVVIPHGWGRKFFTEYYEKKFSFHKIYVDNIDQVRDRITNLAMKYDRMVICVNQPFSYEPVNQPFSYESENFPIWQCTNVTVLTPYLPNISEQDSPPFSLYSDSQPNKWKTVIFHPKIEWRKNFIAWICKRLPNCNIDADIIKILDEFDPEKKQFPSPKSLLPIIFLFYKKGIDVCRNLFNDGDLFREVLRTMTGDEKLALSVQKGISKFIMAPQYSLDEILERKVWITFFDFQIFDKVMKKGIIEEEKNKKYKLSAWCIDGLCKKVFKSMLLEIRENLGNCFWDRTKQPYLDQIIDDLNNKEWLFLCKSLLKRFDKTNIFKIAELEAIFSAAARKFEKGEKVSPTEYPMMKTIFKTQMQILVRRYPNGWLVPLTRLWKPFHDPGCLWIGDCWLWDLSDFIEDEMIPEAAKILFPIHGKPNLHNWIQCLKRSTSIEQPTSSDPSKDYFRLMHIAMPLLKQLSLSAEMVKDIPLLFPAWCICNVISNVEPDMQPFLKGYLPLGRYIAYREWDKCLLQLADKYCIDKKQTLATLLLRDSLLVYAQNIKHGNTLISMISEIKESYPFLMKFIEDFADIQPSQEILQANLPEECELDRIYSLSDKWKQILLDSIIATEKGKELLAHYMRSKHGMVFEMEEKYWLEIIDKIEPQWMAAKVLWQNLPQVAFKQAKKALSNRDHDAMHWFGEAPDSELEKLCDVLLKSKDSFLPDWCKEWFARRIYHPSMRHFLMDLYKRIIYR